MTRRKPINDPLDWPRWRRGLVQFVAWVALILLAAWVLTSCSAWMWPQLVE